MKPIIPTLLIIKGLVSVLLLVVFGCQNNPVTEEAEKIDMDITPAFKSAVYIGDPFQIPNPPPDSIQKMISVANTLAASDFNVLLLSFLHVDTTDHLTYDYKAWFDGPNAASKPVFDQLPALFANIKNAQESQLVNGKIVAGQIYEGAPKKWILFSLGGYDNSQDALRAYAPNNGNVYQRIKTVLNTYNIDGIYLDYEPFRYGVNCSLLWESVVQTDPPNPNNKRGIDTAGFAQLQDYQMLANLTDKLRSEAGATYITAAPYEEQSWWGSVGASHFDWWNVQFYVGGSNECPSEWVDNFKEWLSVASGKPGNFLVPGCNADVEGFCSFNRDSMTVALNNLKQANLQAGGAFIWDYEHIQNDDPSAWAKAIAGQ